MYFKQKFIYIFLILNLLGFNTLSASTYDNDTLNIFAKIIPRFIIMSSQKKKIKENIKICILNDDTDKLTALSLIDKINDEFPNGLQKHKMEILSNTYKSVTQCKDSQLIFMFNSNTKSINKAVLFSNKHQILTMSYDYSLLQNGVGLSLFIGRKVLPYINMQAMKNNTIVLDNILLRVSKIYKGSLK